MPLRETYASQMNDPMVAANTIASFTGPQNLIMTTGNAAYVAAPTIITPGYLKTGMGIYTRASGTFANASTTPTMVIGLYYDTTVLGVNAALTETSGATIQMPWWLELFTVVRSAAIPTAVVTFTSGILTYGTSLTVITTPLPVPATAQATVNVDNSVTAGNKELAVKATCGTSAAGNTITLHELLFLETTHI